MKMVYIEPMKNLPKKLLIWPVIVLLLVGLLQVKPNNMLCISSDGAVDFESLCIPGNEISEDACCTEVCTENRDEKECNDCSDLEIQFSILSGRIFQGQHAQFQQLNNPFFAPILLKKSVLLGANIYFDIPNQTQITNPPSPNFNNTVLIC